MDSLSSLRVSQRLFAHHSGGSEMSFYRLSMPIECAAVLISPVGGVLPVASNSLSPGSEYITFNIISYTVQYVQVTVSLVTPEATLKYNDGAVTR